MLIRTKATLALYETELGRMEIGIVDKAKNPETMHVQTKTGLKTVEGKLIGIRSTMLESNLASER